MQGAAAVLLITLGIGQLSAAAFNLGGLSLSGRYRWPGVVLGVGLVGIGCLILPLTPWVLLWTPLAGVAALGILLLGGSFIVPIPDPNKLFEPDHPEHGGCEAVQIPDGPHQGPGFLVCPKEGAEKPGNPTTTSNDQAIKVELNKLDSSPARLVNTLSTGKHAVCIVPGAGGYKLFFKWQLVSALLAKGLTVLIIDLPGHGDYRRRPLAYPDCLSAVPAAIKFLRQQLEFERVGLLGISLGGAVAIRATADAGPGFVDALAVVATPTHLNFSDRLFYQEVWRTFYQSPLVPLLREVTARQSRAMWRNGGYRGQHTTAEMFDLLNPLQSVEQVTPTPLLLVYSQRDAVAPLSQARALHQAAPHARLLLTKKASHVMLTLMPAINSQIAGWFRAQLNN